jgi:hypothetical protein
MDMVRLFVGMGTMQARPFFLVRDLDLEEKFIM